MFDSMSRILDQVTSLATQKGGRTNL